MAQMRGESTKHARFSTMQDANDQMGAGWKRARGEPTPAARLPRVRLRRDCERAYGGVPGDVTHFSAGHLLAARLILA